MHRDLHHERRVRRGHAAELRELRGDAIGQVSALEGAAQGDHHPALVARRVPLPGGRELGEQEVGAPLVAALLAAGPGERLEASDPGARCVVDGHGVRRLVEGRVDLGARGLGVDQAGSVGRHELGGAAEHPRLGRHGAGLDEPGGLAARLGRPALRGEHPLASELDSLFELGRVAIHGDPLGVELVHLRRRLAQRLLGVGLLDRSFRQANDDEGVLVGRDGAVGVEHRQRVVERVVRRQGQGPLALGPGERLGRSGRALLRGGRGPHPFELVERGDAHRRCAAPRGRRDRREDRDHAERLRHQGLPPVTSAGAVAAAASTAAGEPAASFFAGFFFGSGSPSCRSTACRSGSAPAFALPSRRLCCSALRRPMRACPRRPRRACA